MSDDEQTPEYWKGYEQGRLAGSAAGLVAHELQALAKRYDTLSAEYESADYWNVAAYLRKCAEEWERRL